MSLAWQPGMLGGELCSSFCMPAGLLQRAEEISLDKVGCASVRVHLAPQASTAWRS